MDNPYTTLYCLVMAVWSTLLMEVWKRKQNEIAHLWSMKSHKRDDQVRPNFKADMTIDSESRTVKRTNVTHTMTRRFFGEIPIVSVSIAAVIACFIGNLVYVRDHTDSASSVGASIISAIVIIVLDAVYRLLATMMADWENHRYEDDYESSLITKNFAFSFVNSNIMLFSIAFYEQDFNKLTLNLAIILAVKQIALSALEIILPSIMLTLKKWRIDRIFATDFKGKAANRDDQAIQYQVEMQRQLVSEKNMLVMGYSDIFIKMGYVMLFAQAFPLAPFLSILTNFLEMKSTMNNLAFYSKRFQALPSSGIGTWLHIGELLTLASVAVNCAIIFYTSEALDQIVDGQYKDNKLYQFMIIVMIEHIIITFKFALSTIIKDKPEWVSKEEHEIYESQGLLQELMERKLQEYKEAGNETLEEQVNYIRELQKKKAAKQMMKAYTMAENKKKDGAKAHVEMHQKKLKRKRKVTLFQILQARQLKIDKKRGVN